MLDAVHGVLGTTDGEREARYQGSAERYQEGLEEMRGGDRMGCAKAIYSKGFFPGGGADFERERGLLRCRCLPSLRKTVVTEKLESASASIQHYKMQW
jgi:hypothetical protein